jgi:hypothetical protein
MKENEGLTFATTDGDSADGRFQKLGECFEKVIKFNLLNLFYFCICYFQI